MPVQHLEIDSLEERASLETNCPLEPCDSLLEVASWEDRVAISGLCFWIIVSRFGPVSEGHHKRRGAATRLTVIRVTDKMFMKWNAQSRTAHCSKQPIEVRVMSEESGSPSIALHAQIAL